MNIDIDINDNTILYLQVGSVPHKQLEETAGVLGFDFSNLTSKHTRDK